mmetsp:Transcript_16331/g.28609  ORF Transcript_16331/g.28609 Transcript_16331/m.28609 type:complete len:564 (+) Transcript_16331:72-1763(+)
MGGGSVPCEPGEEPARCVADVEEADFVTLRLDTAEDPSLLKSNGKLGLEDVYANHVKGFRGSQESPLPLRLGLCCAIWRDSQRHWELRSHELGLWPGSVLEMPAEVLRARWQAAGCGQKEGPLVSRWAGQLAESTRWVLAALHAKRAPLVVHDGLTDLLQLYDKFAGDLPAGHLEFGRAWMEKFPVILDTRLIAEQDEVQNDTSIPADTPAALMKWRCMPGSGGGLAELHKHLLETPRPSRSVPSSRFKEQGLYTHRASSGRSGIVTNSGVGLVARGAMEIAEVFLLLMSHKLQSAIHDEAEERRKRRKTGQSSPMSPSRSTQSGQQSRTLQKKTSTVSAISTASGMPSTLSDEKSSRAGPTTGAARSGAASAGSEVGQAGSDDCSGAASKEAVPTKASRDVGTPPKSLKAKSQRAATLPSSKASDTLEALAKPAAEMNGVASPEGRRKRPRSNSSEKAAECSAALALLTERLAGIPKDDGSASSSEFSTELQHKAAAVCRYFHNRVAAPESLPGHLRLDTLLQVQLIKRLRKAQGSCTDGAPGLQAPDKCKLQQVSLDSHFN